MSRPSIAEKRGTARSFDPRSLDAVNFLLADVRGSLGPYLNVFLVTRQHWAQASVGWVTMVGGLLGLAFQMPVGALIDRTRAKRGLIVAALAVLALGALVIFTFPSFWPVMAANLLMAVVGDLFGPSIAAITLGLVRRQQLARRLARNSAFDHMGNVAIATLAGGVGYVFSQRAVFLLVPFFAALAAAAVLSIPAAAIDHERARGLHGPQDEKESTSSGEKPAGWKVLLECRPLLIFAVCAMLFHFANAPLLPLVGQKLALANRNWATAMMSACIIAAQLVMLPMALLVGRTADIWGRKPLLLAAFAILPVRAVLCNCSPPGIRQSGGVTN